MSIFLIAGNGTTADLQRLWRIVTFGKILATAISVLSQCQWPLFDAQLNESTQRWISVLMLEELHEAPALTLISLCLLSSAGSANSTGGFFPEGDSAHSLHMPCAVYSCTMGLPTCHAHGHAAVNLCTMTS